MSVRPHHTCISVADIDAVTEWYQRVLGFETEKAFTIPTGAKVALLASTGGARVELTEVSDSEAGNQWCDPGGSLQTLGMTHIAFEVDDVDAIYAAAIASGAVGVWEPRDGKSGARMAFVHDNEGNLVEFFDPGDSHGD